MESQATIDIVVFPERQEFDDSDGSIRAQSDEALQCSVISQEMINRLRVTYTPGQKAVVKDSRNVQHSLVGKVDLRWHRKGQGKSHPETFFVEDSATPMVILGATAFQKSYQLAGANAFPVGVEQQTGGLHFPSSTYPSMSLTHQA
ncbi:MAG: hypothetical protein Q9201_003710 [Fulgogasparrea decipioides]